MKFRILSNTEKEVFGCDAMAVVDYTDVAALGAVTTGTLNVAPATTAGLMPALGVTGTDTLPAGFVVSLLHMVVDTAFVSGTATGLAIIVGDTGTTNRYLASSQLQAGQTPITGAVGTLTNQPYRYSAAGNVNITLTSTAANLNTFTAGSMRFFFQMDDQSQLPKS